MGKVKIEGTKTRFLSLAIIYNALTIRVNEKICKNYFVKMEKVRIFAI